jgi:hypothetical protein
MVYGHELCMDSLIQLFRSSKSKKRTVIFVEGQALLQNSSSFFFSMDKAFVYFRRDCPYFLSLEEAHNDSWARVTNPSSCDWVKAMFLN